MSMKDSLVQSDCLGETLGQRLGGHGASKKLRNPTHVASKIEAGIGNCLAKRFPILLRILMKAIFACSLDLVTL